MTNETPEQLEAMGKQIAKSLSRAGIGKIYHNRALGEFGDVGKAIIADMDDKEVSYTDKILTGFGYHIRCTKLESMDFPFILAKAMRLMRLDCRVSRLLPLLDFINRMERGELEDIPERFHNFDGMQALIIPGFYEPLDTCPFTPKEIYRIENFLRARIEDGLSVSIQYTGEIAQQTWFSDYFVKTLVANTYGVNL